MGVTSLSLVFSECVVLCVTCRPLMCGLQPPGATPATHPSGMQSPCSPPAGRSSHTQGSGQGQALPGLDILGGGRVHTASQHSSTQLPSTALGSGLPSHLPHRAPLPPPKDSSGACDVSWGGAHLPRFPSAVCLIKKKKQNHFLPFKFCKCTSKCDCANHLYVCPGSWSAHQATLPGRVSRSGVEEPGALSWDLLVLCGGIRR